MTAARIRADQSDVDTDQFHGGLDSIEFGRRELPSDGQAASSRLRVDSTPGSAGPRAGI